MKLDSMKKKNLIVIGVKSITQARVASNPKNISRVPSVHVFTD